MDLHAVIGKKDLEGAANVLRALRDGKLKTLAFLLMSADFGKEPLPGTTDDATSESSDDEPSPGAAPNDPVGCSFREFMRKFWGKQAYPVSTDTRDGPIEVQDVDGKYRRATDAAVSVTFRGVHPATQQLAFRVAANAHYLQTMYQLPLGTLYGEIPPIRFLFRVRQSDDETVALFTIRHVNPPLTPTPASSAAVSPLAGPTTSISASIGERLIVDIGVQFPNLPLLTQFGMKFAKLSAIASLAPADRGRINLRDIVGHTLEGIKAGFLVADGSSSDWISLLASVFNVKVALNTCIPEITYVETGCAVLPEADFDSDAETAGAGLNTDDIDLSSFAKEDLTRLVDGADGETTEQIVERLLPGRPVEQKALMALVTSGRLARMMQRTRRLTRASAVNASLSTHSKKRPEYEPFQNDVAVDVLSGRLNMVVALTAALHDLKTVLDHHITLAWEPFTFSVAIPQSTQLFALSFKKGCINFTMNDMRMYRSKTDLDDPSSLQVFLMMMLDKSKEVRNKPPIKNAEKPRPTIAKRKRSVRLSSSDESDADSEMPSHEATSDKAKPPPDSNLTANRLSVAEEDAQVARFVETLKKVLDGWLDTREAFIDLNFSISNGCCNFVMDGNSPRLADSSVTTGPQLLVLPGVLPSASILAISSKISAALGDSQLHNRVPSFFDNLANTNFDFVGYGIFSLIFNIIYPNPDHGLGAAPLPGEQVEANDDIRDGHPHYHSIRSPVPGQHTMYNVELSLPPMVAHIFSRTVEGGSDDLPGCIASVGTATEMRIWTQIVNGVLTNMYTVVSTKKEQQDNEQILLSPQQASHIIDRFSGVLKLPRELFASTSEVARVTDPDPGSTRSKRHLGLLRALPVHLIVANLSRIIRTLDHLSAKREVVLSTANLWNDQDPNSAKSEGSTDLMHMPLLITDVLDGLLASYTLRLNGPSVAPSKPRDIYIKPEGCLFHVVASSPSNSQMDVLAMIKIPGMQPAADDSGPSSLTETSVILNPNDRYRFPVIRWGDTSLSFKFHKFRVTLQFSRGELEITQGGERLLFAALADFQMRLTVNAFSLDVDEEAVKKPSQSSRQKHLFHVRTIRQLMAQFSDFAAGRFKPPPSLSNIVVTKSIVTYGPKSQRISHRHSGIALIKNFLHLHRALVNRIFAIDDNQDASVAGSDAEDPATAFNMLLTFGGSAVKHKRADPAMMPCLNLPCFFTNYCSKDQMNDYYARNRVTMEKDDVPVELQIRNLFQPLTDSLAQGFASLLPAFYFPSYPGYLQWTLETTEDQLVGMEMNGLGLFAGKTGPLRVTRIAPIPYANARTIEPSVNAASESVITKARRRQQKRTLTKTAILASADQSESRLMDSWVSEDEISSFEKAFYRHSGSESPSNDDVVVIPAVVQFPDTLKTVLRNLLWPMFVPGHDLTIGPPIINPYRPKKDVLNHAPISIALSDTVPYRAWQPAADDPTLAAQKPAPPSLLSVLLCAFIEESSSSGLDVHSPSPHPDRTEVHYALSPNGLQETFSFAGFCWMLINGKETDVSLWLKFPWPMSSLGVDLGDFVSGIVSLEGVNLFAFEVNQHHLQGAVGTMRIDIHVLASGADIRSHISSIFGKGVSAAFKSIDHLPFSVYSRFGDAFTLKTEAAVPLLLFKGLGGFFTSAISSHIGSPSTLSRYHAGNIKYTPLETNLDFRQLHPDSVACVFTKKTLTQAAQSLHNARWSSLDLSLSRIYYPLEASPRPNDEFFLVLQLRNASHEPLCGQPEKIKTVAIALEYIRPSEPLESVFGSLVPGLHGGVVDYHRARFEPRSSVYIIEKIRLPYPGRYNVHVAFSTPKIDKPKKSKQPAEAAASKSRNHELKELKYTKIKFTEVYVQNAR